MRNRLTHAVCSVACLGLISLAPAFAEDMAPATQPAHQGMKMDGMNMDADTKPGTDTKPGIDAKINHGGLYMNHAAPTEAVAVLHAFKNSGVSGTVRFTDLGNGSVKVHAMIAGLAPNSVHAIHVHEFGDVSSDDGESAGSHFNPEKHQHGKPGDASAHPGDLGNLTADADGNAMLELTVNTFSLTDKDPVLGRSVILHAKPDDFGQPTGNAGGRIAGGIIGVAKAK